MAESFVEIFSDWVEVTKALSDAEKGRLIDAMVIYAQGGNWQDFLSGNERYLFPTFRLNIERSIASANKRTQAATDAANARWHKKAPTTDANACERMRTDADACGGMRTDADTCEPMRKKSPPHSIYNIYSLNSPSNTNTERDIDLQEKRESVERGSGGKPKKRFVPPTEAEVAAYALERGCTTFNAARFCDYYASNGWKVGKNPMKDWRATVRNWISNDAKANASGSNALVYEDIDWDHTF